MTMYLYSKGEIPKKYFKRWILFAYLAKCDWMSERSLITCIKHTKDSRIKHNVPA